MTREEYNDISTALDRIMKRVADDETLPKKAAIGAVGVLGGFQLFIKEYYEKHTTATPQGLGEPRDCGKGIHKQEYTGCDMNWMDESQRLDEAAEEYEKDLWLSGIHDKGYRPREMVEAFKAGAKWMAEQGETVEGEIVCAVAHPHENKVIARVNGNYKFGDIVIVQIRKA